MGFNTTILVLNDALDVLENDPEAGKKIAAGIKQMGGGGHKSVTVPIGNHCDPVQIIETHHADMTSVIAVGGNYGRQVGLILGRKFKDDLNELKEIRKEITREIRKLEGKK